MAGEGTADVRFRDGLIALCNTRVGRLATDLASVKRFTGGSECSQPEKLKSAEAWSWKFDHGPAEGA
jgi:hypothetical protein